MTWLGRFSFIAASLVCAYAFGIPLIFLVLLPFVLLIALLRMELLESLFPQHSYQKNCLNIFGLEEDPNNEITFRNNLASAIYTAFPGRNKPTACCCIIKGKEKTEITVTLHNSHGHIQFRSSDKSETKAMDKVFEKILNYRNETPFTAANKMLFPNCRSCRIRKAHRLVNLKLSHLNPLTLQSKWKHFLAIIHNQQDRNIKS